MQHFAFFDIYEFFQLSPNADAEMIGRIHQILAQRYAPENPISGNAELLHRLTEGFRTLGDPNLRAAYDLTYKAAHSVALPVSQGLHSEKHKRHEILSVLYQYRMSHPVQPSMGTKELEDQVGIPKEQLDFAFWYLREGNYMERSDNGRVVITFRGVDLLEEGGQPDQRAELKVKLATDWKGLLAPPAKAS